MAKRKSKTKSGAKPVSKPQAPLEDSLQPESVGDAVEPQTASVVSETGEVKQIRERAFPVVGIGASAGGLEAFTQVLEFLPADTGMAFVLVQHLAPTHESMLTELLSRATKMPVAEVRDGVKAEPDHIYVIPPNTNMAILHGVLHLMPRPATPGHHMPIDYFFRSLADDQKSKSIGVILSGTASDGALGLKAIKAEGGITFAQDEKTAKYDGMPRSAVAAGYVDLVLSPEKIAKELARLGRHPYVNHIKIENVTELISEGGDDFNKILILLRSATGVDFTYYKHSTIQRRIVRRMVLHKIDDLKTYVKYLQANAGEVEALYNDILINVTSFFRDPETFQVLTESVFPAIMKNRASDEQVRIWVPGCSTGEEPYSIAISILEFLGDRANSTPVQIFATDISDVAIEKARAGIFLENITIDVLPERISRFFVKVENGYQISKTIRDMCVFAKQNLTKDPPFSKLDLISCRNVLIYLGPMLQKKVMPILHYALKPDGLLMLGSSEAIGTFSDLFALVEKKHKIYSKKMTTLRPAFDFTAGDFQNEKTVLGKAKGARETSSFDLEKEADLIVMSRYAPAGVIINEDMEILQFRGRTGYYLEPAPGEATLNLLRMAREGLSFDLRTAIHKARKTDAPVRKKGVQVRYNGNTKEVNIEVIPIKSSSSKERFLMVLFEEAPPPADSKKVKVRETKSEKTKRSVSDSQITNLKQELGSTKEYLQSLIEEQEATNEELRAANEEIQSSNEELQSTNEELETAKEELQSTNEELITVNEELENRNLELSQVNNDLTNLISSAQLPIIMLGSDLRIRRFTPMAEKALNLIPTDVGRKITDLKPNINVQELEKLALSVVDTLNTIEREVQDRDGHWHSMRIRPYKTSDNKIEGVVISFVDINSLKQSIDALQIARDYTVRAIVDTAREPLLILDKDLRVKAATKAFYQSFHVSAETTENKLIYDLGNRQWDIPKLRTLLEEIIPKNNVFENFEVEHEFQGIGRKKMLLNARRVVLAGDDTSMILLAIEEVTGR